MSEATAGSPLSVNVFTAPGKAVVGERPHPFGPGLAWDPTTSTLIYGERDAVLVDPLTTAAEAEALARWVKLHNRNLSTVYVTHSHPDHYFGLGVILERFPEAMAIATQKSVEIMAATEDFSREVYRTMFPGGMPRHIARPEPYADDTFTLEGHELRIISQGHTDTIESTSLHVPALDLVVGGDVLYNECHMFVGETTPDSRREWIAALDRLAALNPRIAVAGHKKTGVPDGPEAIIKSRRYLETFDRLVAEGHVGRELYEQMLTAYPDYDSPQAWLMLGFGFPVNPPSA